MCNKIYFFLFNNNNNVTINSIEFNFSIGLDKKIHAVISAVKSKKMTMYSLLK